MTNCAYLLIGGNQGNRQQFLKEAREAISRTCGSITNLSHLYETEAWGKEDQEPFLNQAVELQTHLHARQLLQQLLAIEESMGRVREQRFGPRTIDLDILFFNQEIVDEPGLHLPHPRMAYRRFVLQPLAEIAAPFVHPVYQKTVQQLLEACTDPLQVMKIEEKKE